MQIIINHITKHPEISNNEQTTTKMFENCVVFALIHDGMRQRLLLFIIILGLDCLHLVNGTHLLFQ